MHRLVRGLSELREVVPGAPPRVVVNRVRSSVVGRDPRRQVAEALERYAGVIDPVLVPDDPAAFDAALLQARPVGEVAAASPARQALAHLAADLVGRAPAGAAASSAPVEPPSVRVTAAAGRPGSTGRAPLPPQRSGPSDRLGCWAPRQSGGRSGRTVRAR